MFTTGTRGHGRLGAVRHGMTANAFASVSLYPLLALVCVVKTP